MVNDEFDLEAINLLMENGLTDFSDRRGLRAPTYIETFNNVNSNQRQGFNRPSIVFQGEENPMTVAGIWYNKLTERNVVEATGEPLTRPGSPPDPQAPSDTRSPSEVDETYRMSLVTQMKPKWSEEPFPSTEFLVSLLTNVHELVMQD
jgi:hypothetical protein